MFRKLTTPDPVTGATHAGPRGLRLRPIGTGYLLFRSRPDTGIAQVGTLTAAAEYVRETGL